MANLQESSEEEEQQHDQDDLEDEREWFDLEDRGMCPPCSLEKGEDVPLPESEVCPVCRYGDRSQPINIRQAEVTRTFIGHGVVLYALFVPEHVSPLGLVLVLRAWHTDCASDSER
jgi:rubredoxin